MVILGLVINGFSRTGTCTPAMYPCVLATYQCVGGHGSTRYMVINGYCRIGHSRFHNSRNGGYSRIGKVYSRNGHSRVGHSRNGCSRIGTSTLAMYPCEPGCVSMCRWPCNYVFMYLHEHCCKSTWSYIHMRMHIMQNLVIYCGPLHRICLCPKGQSEEFDYLLWAIVNNLVMGYGLQQRVSLGAMGHGTESLTRAQNHMNFIKKIV
jgi:hypothetical protein